MMYVKGAALAAIPIFIRQKFGENGYIQWIGELKPGAQEVYREGIVEKKWYPLNETLNEPLQRMCDMFYNGSLHGAVESGKFSADQGLKGLLKLFVRIGSPSFIVSQAGNILPTYYNPCEMRTIKNSSKSATVQATKFPEMNELIEARIAGWIQRALEMHGCKNVNIEITKSLTSGAEYTEYLINWA